MHVRPSVSVAPLGGIFAAIQWSLQRGETVQLELVGLTAVAELDEENVMALYSKSKNANEGS